MRASWARPYSKKGPRSLGPRARLAARPRFQTRAKLKDSRGEFERAAEPCNLCRVAAGKDRRLALRNSLFGNQLSGEASRAVNHKTHECFLLNSGPETCRGRTPEQGGKQSVARPLWECVLAGSSFNPAFPGKPMRTLGPFRIEMTEPYRLRPRKPARAA